MREIKFRAWWKDTGKLIKDFQEEYTIEALNDEQIFVEQFTGLKDKNGREIYEGDIVKSDMPKDMTVYVEWNQLDGSWHCFDKKHKFHEAWTLGHFTTDGLTVIGNIHENSELLNEPA